MAEPLKKKGKRALGKSKRATITKVRRKTRNEGVRVKDRVGAIQLTVDPVELQRCIRDEWAAGPGGKGCQPTYSAYL